MIDADELVQTCRPPEITESLSRLMADLSSADCSAFVMMEFGRTRAHASIYDAIQTTLECAEIRVMRADDKQYHDDLFWNVVTYLHGCTFGIAVFERLEAETFNPNVAFEVGYLGALQKPVCILKDKTLPALPTDLIGRLYKSFDVQSPDETIDDVLKHWLLDRGLLEEDTESWSSVASGGDAPWPAQRLENKASLDYRILQRLFEGKARRDIARELDVSVFYVFDIYVLNKSRIRAIRGKEPAGQRASDHSS